MATTAQWGRVSGKIAFIQPIHGRGLLFCPIERTHSEKEVVGEVISWPVKGCDTEKDGWIGTMLSMMGTGKSRAGMIAFSSKTG